MRWSCWARSIISPRRDEETRSIEEVNVEYRIRPETAGQVSNTESVKRSAGQVSKLNNPRHPRNPRLTDFLCGLGVLCGLIIYGIGGASPTLQFGSGRRLRF